MWFRKRFNEERAVLIKATYATMHAGLLNFIPMFSNLENHTWDKQQCIKVNMLFTKAINILAQQSFDIQRTELKECWDLLLEVNDSLNIVRKNMDSKEKAIRLGYAQHDFICLTNIMANTIHLLDEK